MTNKQNTPVNDELDTFELPAGFTLVSDGSLCDEWDYEENTTITGTVIQKKVVPIRRQKGVEDTHMIVVDGVGGPRAVWQSAGLKELFSMVEVGDGVYIKYLGVQALDGGRNPMKVFASGINKRERNSD